MSNPAGPATSATRLTQGIRQRRKKKQSPLTEEQKKQKRVLHGSSSSQVKKAFDLGLRASNLSFLAGQLWSEIVHVNELMEAGDITPQTATTTKSKIFDLLRRIHDKLDMGPAIPDIITLELETDAELKTDTDRPEALD